MQDWQESHPDYNEIQCDGCKQKMRGTPFEIEDWIRRHEGLMHHQVRPRK